MDSQLFSIKYIEAVFPHVENVAEFVIQSEYRVLPFEIETAMTDGKWAVFGDDLQRERQVQSFVREKMKVSFSTRQELKYQLAQVADFATILTNDGQQLIIYNIELDYSELNDRVWFVEMTFFVHKPNEISSNCESNFVFSTGKYNRLQMRIDKPVYEIFAVIGDVTANGFEITVPNINEYSNLVVDNVFYWHSNIDFVNENKELVGEAKIISKDANEIVIELFYSGVVLIGRSEIYRFILNNIPDVNNVVTNISAMNFNIYTKFQPRFIFSTILGDELTDGEFLTLPSKIGSQIKLDVLFYVSKDETWKIKYMPFADLMNFIDRKNNFTYKIQQIFNSFAVNERADIVDLYEIKFSGIINNLVK